MINILYVEDEPFLAKIVKETLESEKYHVTLIEDGAEAAAAYQPEKIDICILDIMLPNKNGFEIAEEIRQKNKGVPIIFLTAKNQTDDVLKGFGVGGNDYIKKPFSMDELIVRIENLLRISDRKKVEQKNELIQIGSIFSFHPQKFELQFENSKKTLSHRESQILEMLCVNKNGTTERKSILMKVWGDDSFYNSRNLDVYIAKLRRYLSAADDVKILTLKGVGYVLVEEDGMGG